ncbi:MAG: DUF2147 domain-containing protein [Tardiphaga sp.]
MKKCLAIAVLLLASTTAQAQYTFDYGGRTITIDPDRGTVSIPGVYDNTGKKAKRSRSEDGDPDRPGKKAPQQAKTAPQAAPETATPPAPAPAEQATAPAAAPAPTAPASTAPAPATASRGETSSATAAVAPAGAAAPAPQLQPSAPAVEPAPAPVAAPQPAPAAQKQAAAPATSTPSPANSPLGVWLTEEKEGKVRIEQCGPNLCGYSVDKKSNQNGEQVLINMKPGKDKWSGRILDPTSGSTYDSTIALKGTDSLRVQGCAFGGVFCGGQTWTRVN